MFFAPLHNWRHVKVTERRTKQDWAYCMRDLVDVHFPDAVRIRLVEDNLNTHDPAALYEAFAPAEAKRILDRLEFHYTPKHGSWLNMAEIELSVLSRQCLDRRIPDQACPGTRGRSLGSRAQRRPGHGQLALHDQLMLASNSSDSTHQLSLDRLLVWAIYHNFLHRPMAL